MITFRHYVTRGVLGKALGLPVSPQVGHTIVLNRYVDGKSVTSTYYVHSVHTHIYLASDGVGPVSDAEVFLRLAEEPE